MSETPISPVASPTPSGVQETMVQIQRLVRLLQDVEEQLAVCNRCGLCQAVCPLFAATGREADVARGKLALLQGLAKDLVRDPQGVQERLQRCLLCGTCAHHCPSGVRVVEIFLRARAVLTAYLGLSPLRKTVFRGLLARPHFFHRLLAVAAKCQGFFLQPADALLGSSCARFQTPLLADRHIRPLAATPFHQQVPEYRSPAAPGQPTAVFFVGCLIDKFFPEVGRSVLQALEWHGVGVLVPAAQGCCGLPALSAGDLTAFGRLVRHHLQVIQQHPAAYWVSACATCTATIKTFWPTLLPEATAAEKAALAQLAHRTMDISQFLVDVIGLPPPATAARQPELTVTYHDPCHLKKSLGMAAQPRAILQATPGLHLVEMAEADLCCGCGGSFNLQHYDLSRTIGRRKVDHILASGAAAVATGCPACMLQFLDLLSQSGAKVRVCHVLELYAAGRGPRAANRQMVGQAVTTADAGGGSPRL